jgi:predicted ester cyclase
MCLNTKLNSSVSKVVFSIIALSCVYTSVSARNVALETGNKEVVKNYRASQWSKDSNFSGSEYLSTDYKLLRAEFQNLVINANDPYLEKAAQHLSVALSDRVDRINEIIAEDDRVGIKYQITAIHRGNLYGIPATGKAIDIEAFAFYKLADNKIVEAWEMVDEAALLKQLGVWLPERSDGKSIAPAIIAPTRDGNDVLAEIQSKPEDAQAYRNKLLVSAYKSANPPPGLLPAEGRPYKTYTRSGFYHMGVRGKELGVGDQNIGQAFPDRRDQVGIIISEGNTVMFHFLLAGTNTKSLFGITPSNTMIQAWEAGVHTFEGEVWTEGWWFGDDVGMLLQLGAPGEFLIP